MPPNDNYGSTVEIRNHYSFWESHAIVFVVEIRWSLSSWAWVQYMLNEWQDTYIYYVGQLVQEIKHERKIISQMLIQRKERGLQFRYHDLIFHGPWLWFPPRFMAAIDLRLWFIILHKYLKYFSIWINLMISKEAISVRIELNVYYRFQSHVLNTMGRLYFKIKLPFLVNHRRPI